MDTVISVAIWLFEACVGFALFFLIMLVLFTCGAAVMGLWDRWNGHEACQDLLRFLEFKKKDN